VTALHAGDLVYISGKAFTCRSRLHRYVFDEGHPMPPATKDKNLLIHVGPVIIPVDGGGWRLMSFMPTSSIRFEKWGAQAVDKWNLKMIIGKTTMGKSTTKTMQKKKCVHCTPQGVTPNLFIDHIKITGVDYLNELGSIEAAWQLELNKLGPFVVDIDCMGNNLFDELDKTIEENKKEAYRIMGIPPDFEFTKLY
jgi:tartrate/fumarate subfamily iron-sulfur-dependent hydro-lyase beta chain